MKTASRTRQVAITLATLIIFALALYALSRLLREIHPAMVLDSLSNVPLHRLWAALGCAAGSYFMLTLYDWLAVRGIGRKLAYSHVAMTSFTAFGISHTAGLSSISGGSVRYRCYATEGFSALEIAGIMTLVAINFFLGVGTLLGSSLVLGAHGASQVISLDVTQTRALGFALLSVVLGYLVLTYFKREPIRFRDKTIQLPSLRLSIGQLLVSSTDLCFAAGTLYVLLPHSAGIAYPAFVGVYVVAMQAGVLSNVPGGLGVFESVLLLLLPGSPSDALLGAVLLYRLIYYVLPFLLALGLAMGREALHKHGQLRQLGYWLRDRWRRR